MSVVVACSADEAARYTQFTIAIQGLEAPLGTRVLWFLGNDFAGNRNGAVQHLGEDDYLWFMDDDHAFKPELLNRLLAWNVNVVAPLCLRRQAPFTPVAMDFDDLPLNLRGEPGAGLRSVKATGTAGMLIHRRVLEAMEPPWFRLENGMSEDYVFCQRVREAGFEIHVDLGLLLGHITTAVVWPTFAEGEWRNGFTFGDGTELQASLLSEEVPV